MNTFWSGYVILLVVIVVIGSAWLLQWTKTYKVKNIKEGEKLDHDFDGIVELNNPLPRWWLWLFWICIFFAVGYLLLYPGFGNMQGYHQWSSERAWQAEKEKFNMQYGPIFQAYLDTAIPELAKDEKAMEIGKRLFSNHCAICHGADARGMFGFPNLMEGTWIYGGTPDDIKATIMYGRQGVMPAMGKVIQKEESINELVAYVLSLNNRQVDTVKAKRGEVLFQRHCALCHGPDAKGKKEMSAPNLTDNTWTYSGTPIGIEMTIRNGRQGQMPAHEHILGEAKVHLLTAYIWGHSKKTESRAVPEPATATEPSTQ